MSAVAEFLRISNRFEVDFPSLLGNSPRAFVLCQADGTISSFNRTAEQLLGLKPHSSSGRFIDLIHPGQRALAEREFCALLQGTRSTFDIETRTHGLNSLALRWIGWRVKGEPNAVLALAEEIPDVSAVENRLRRAQRFEAIGRLAGGVAHDFNNLLTGVLLYCDLLMASLDSGHPARKYADEIRKAGFQAASTVRQLLAVDRPTTSQSHVLCLNEIVAGMRNLLSRLIGENFELTFQLDAELGLVNMEPSQAQQILLNLVLNARDAMPEGGRIWIETRNCKVQVLPDVSPGVHATTLPCALVVVSDNGPGMDESVRARVFEPFFTTKADKGTGLGLSTVHDIVVTRGGLIHVDSEIGRGTRVSVLLPVVPQRAAESLSTSFDSMSHEELSSQVQEKE